MTSSTFIEVRADIGIISLKLYKSLYSTILVNIFSLGILSILFKIKITGSDLKIKKINSSELLIEGNIISIGKIYE